MTIFQIQCFVTAAKEMNFSRAAQKLFISQPGLSRYISGLEKELGTALFERSANKRIVLTEAGADYYDLYSRFLEDSEFLKTKYQRRKEDPFSHFSFGYLAGWDVSFFLPALLDTFEAGHPGVDVKFVSLPHYELFSSLERGELDVVLVPQDYLPDSENVHWKHVLDINYIVLYSDRFLARMPELRFPQDLQDATFYMSADSLIAQRKELAAHFSNEFGFSPKITALQNAETVMAYVKGGMGVTLTDSWGRNVQNPGFYGEALSEPRSIVLAWPANIKHKLPHRIVTELQDILADMKNNGQGFQNFGNHK